MIATLDKVALEGAGSLALETGFDLGWAPGTATYLVGKGVEGWNSGSPIRRSKSDLMGQHGTHAERGYRDERVITVNGHHVAADRAAAAAYVDALNAYLGDGTEGLFRVDDASLGPRWAEVYLAGGTEVAWSGGVDVGFQVNMVAPDPRKYGTAYTSPATGIQQAGKGLTYPLFGAPKYGVLNIGAGGVNGRVQATNTGSADTGVLFTVTADYANKFTITEIGSERRLVYEGLLTTGQSLTLNSGNGQVSLDGTAPRETNLTVAEWSRLDPYASGSWLFEAPDSLNAALTVTVVPAWW